MARTSKQGEYQAPGNADDARALLERFGREGLEVPFNMEDVVLRFELETATAVPADAAVAAVRSSGGAAWLAAGPGVAGYGARRGISPDRGGRMKRGAAKTRSK